MRTSKRSRILQIIVTLTLTIIAMTPFYVLITYAIKSTDEMVSTGLAFPTAVHWGNFSEAIEISDFWPALKNSILTTAPTLALLIIVGAPAAYVIARNSRSKICTAIYSGMIGAMMVPFQSIMLPVYTQLKEMGLLNSIIGFILVKSAFLIPSTVVLMTGFVKSIPFEIEEAAAVDGMHPFSVFWKIVFPLLRPILITVGALDFFNIWNDFSIALIVLQKEKLRTLPLTQFFFFSSRASRVNLAFAACLLSIIPSMIVFFAMQKYIVRGVVAGSVTVYNTRSEKTKLFSARGRRG